MLRDTNVSDAARPVRRIVKAPESFLSKEGIRTVFAEAASGRRDFIRSPLPPPPPAPPRPRRWRSPTRCPPTAATPTS